MLLTPPVRAASLPQMSIHTSYRMSQVAQLLGVSVDTARRWADAGRFPTQADPSGRRTVAGADLAAFATSLADNPTPSGRSARNSFPGLVTRVVCDTVVAQVDIQAGTHRVVSLMTREAVDELGLAPGVEVVAVVKAPHVAVELARP
jgi:molybdopterin-binding protein